VPVPSRRRPRPAALTAALLGLVMAAAMAACSSPATSEQSEDARAEPATDEPTMQPEDHVDLTVYFRRGEGSDAHLEPVTREVRLDDDLPLLALQHLVAGPSEDDGRELSAPLPEQTRVQGLEIADGTATVDLSPHVIADASSVGDSAENEALALSAIAATLAEFPGVERVALTIDGHRSGWHGGVDVGAFWGGWGLPGALVPDDSVIGAPKDGEGVPDLEQFSVDHQHVGSDGDEPVEVESLRIRDRTTYLRFIVELDEDDDRSASVPRTRARMIGGNIVLELEGVADLGEDVGPGTRLDVDHSVINGIEVEETERPGRLRAVVLLHDEREYWLHSTSSPARVILDIRK
jgi:hypothetical protein